jgi:hydrogen peroxide-dependent heme synthase
MQPEKPEEVPGVPLTLEGSAVLHQMFRFRWDAWRSAAEDRRRQAVSEAAGALEEMAGSAGAASALYSLLGHKGDLLLLHFRPSFDELLQAELRLARLPFADFLEPTTSYLSVVELGLYDSTFRLYTSLAERGIAPGSDDWDREVQETIERQRAAMAPRLYPAIPPGRHICFYPMNRKRDASANWYRLAMEKRRDLMREHGETGRKYAGTVKQIVSGSIGFDDWEWGVDLFADDPVVFKKLIYEMRFDEATARYAEFGPFYVGVRLPAGELPSFLSGSGV